MSSRYLCWFPLVIWDCWSTMDLDALQCSECFLLKEDFRGRLCTVWGWMSSFSFFPHSSTCKDQYICLLPESDFCSATSVPLLDIFLPGSLYICPFTFLNPDHLWRSKPKSEDLHEPSSGLLQVASLSLETACIITMTHVLYFFLHSFFFFFFNLDTCIVFSMSKPFLFPHSYPRVASTESPTLEFQQSALTDPPHYSHHTLAHI